MTIAETTPLNRPTGLAPETASPYVDEFDDDMRNIGGDRISGETKVFVLYLADTSGSMRGARIGAVNAGLTSAVKVLRDEQGKLTNTQILFNVLRFGTDVGWVFPQPVPVDEAVVEPLEADGMTNLAGAEEEMESKLHKRTNGGWMDDAKSGYPACIVLQSDGRPNLGDYELALQKLERNGFFATAQRAAIAVDDACDMDMLARFTGNPETVCVAKTTEQIVSTIRLCLQGTVEMSTHMHGGRAADATQELAEAMRAAREEEQETRANPVGGTQHWLDAMAYGAYDFR